MSISYCSSSLSAQTDKETDYTHTLAHRHVLSFRLHWNTMPQLPISVACTQWTIKTWHFTRTIKIG